MSGRRESCQTQVTMQDMGDEYVRNTAGLRAIARSVEQHLHDKGLRDARCVGQFQVSLNGPDRKTIAMRLWGKTYGVHIKDCFDLDQAPLIAEMLQTKIGKKYAL